MIVAIHQPNYIPWTGFFCKMSHCDVFVSFDTVEFPNNGIIHRNKIRTKDGWDWLTIPIEKKKIGLPLKDVSLPQDNSWKKKHWNAIIANYSKSACFSEFKTFFDEIFHDKEFNTIQELNETIICYVAKSFGIHPKFIRASEMDLDFSLRKTDLILNILQNLNCEQYLSGAGGSKQFLEVEKLQEHGINLMYSHVHPVEYAQRWHGFEPFLSSIDLLFNQGGENGRRIIESMQIIQNE